jgi:hypothetical protein
MPSPYIIAIISRLRNPTEIKNIFSESSASHELYHISFISPSLSRYKNIYKLHYPFTCKEVKFDLLNFLNKIGKISNFQEIGSVIF